MHKVARTPLFRHTLVILFLLSGFTWRLHAAEKLTPRQVAELMPQLFALHLSQRDMDPAFTKRLLKQYINQLDPAKELYLKGEADALWNLGDDELARLARQAKIGDFSHFRKLLTDFLDIQVARDAAFFDGLEKREAEIKLLANEKDAKDKTAEAGATKDKAAAPSGNKDDNKGAAAAKPAPAAKSDDDPDKIEWSERAATQAEREKRILKMTALTYKINTSYLSDNEAFKLAIQSIRESRNKWLTVNADEEVPKLFLKSFMAAMDPHTDYFDADEDEFTSALEASFAGIGVQIRPCPLGAQIDDVIKGGPSDKSGKFAARDQIVAVDDFSLAGLPINKIVKRIKGKIGTPVKITLLKYDTKKTEVVTLNRDKIDLDEIRVKGKKYDTPAGPVAVISVAAFYQNVHQAVRERLEELSAGKPLAGVVLDLRYNHGGYLDEAVSLAGLFIESGPVVAERDGRGLVDWRDDTEAKPAYLGPLVVMINQFSASASEIVAGALQDYGRAVIVGSSQTFGKGTVQRVLPLSPLNLPGEIKITTHQFFLPGGSSTQMKGVEPDVTIPGPKLLTDDGMLERSSENAVPWNKIKGALNDAVPDYKLWHAWVANNTARLQELSKKRVAADPEFADAFNPDKMKADSLQEAERKLAPDEAPVPDKNKPEKKDLQADEAVKIVQDMVPTWPAVTAEANAK